MIVIIWMLIGALGWLLLGAVVLAAMDDDSEALLRWARECPFGGATTVILMWPLTVWWILHCAKRNDEKPNVGGNQRERSAAK